MRIWWDLGILSQLIFFGLFFFADFGELTRGRLLHPPPPKILKAALARNQGEIISGDQNGLIRLWDLKADACMQYMAPRIDSRSAQEVFGIPNTSRGGRMNPHQRKGGQESVLLCWQFITLCRQAEIHQ